MGTKIKKQALCIATVASMLDNFNRSNVDILLNMGYEVTLAANFHSREDINSQEKIYAFVKEMRAEGIHIVHIEFSRSIINACMHAKAVLQVKKLLKRQFDLIHCHSPICAVIVRLLACTYRKKYGTKVFYTAHGFHFYKGAPLKNWLLYYPAEMALSRVTDVLVTINREDYKRAVRKLHAKKTVYIPGIGVDIEKFAAMKTKAEEKRRSLGLKKDDILLLSIGELNGNKNHAAVIRALALLKEEPFFARLQYLICGKGTARQALEMLAQRLGISGHVRLLGFREDVADICRCTDIFVHPSKREGLPAALMEAMAAGLPVICSDIRGNKDLVKHGESGLLCSMEEDGTASLIRKLACDEKLRKRLGAGAAWAVRRFDISKVRRSMCSIYRENTGMGADIAE